MNINDEYWAYLLRIGADSTDIGGGFHGPIFENGSFEFVPIPADKEYEVDEDYLESIYGQFTYGNTVDRYRQNRFAQYIQAERIRRRLVDKHMHPDPDFARATYGDLTKNKEENAISKAASLRYLKPNNLLVFCASLDPYPPKKAKCKRALYIIGYLEVKKIYDFEEDKKNRWSIYEKFRERNAHFAYASRDEMNKYYFRSLVFVEGKNCTLLKRAIQLTDEEYRILPKWAKEWGLNCTHFYRGGRWLPQKDRHDTDKHKRRGYISKLRQVLYGCGKYRQRLTTVS